MPDTEKHPSIDSIGEFHNFEKEKIEAVSTVVEFGENELPILLCWISESSWALISTERLVSFRDGFTEEVLAKDCEGCWPVDSMKPFVKQEGAISPHIVESASGNTMQVDLPTGSASIAFEAAALTLSRLNL